MSNIYLIIEEMVKFLNKEYCSNQNVYEEFNDMYNEVLKQRNQVQEYYEFWKKEQKKDNDKYNDIDIVYNKRKSCEKQLCTLRKNIEILKEEKISLEREYEFIYLDKPLFYGLTKMLFPNKIKSYKTKLQKKSDEIFSVNFELKKLRLEKQDIEEKYSKLQSYIEEYNEYLKYKNEIEEYKINNNIKPVNFSLDYSELQKSNPWFGKDYRILQSKLFILALKVKKQFLHENIESLNSAINIYKNKGKYGEEKKKKKFIEIAWSWINFAIPVVSTTFASFDRMFKYMDENTISNLFIDEAGQALPQASVGGIFRSKKVMVVGDPAQIKPVLTLDSKVLAVIRDEYNVSEKYVSAEASTQTLVDEASQYGFWKSDREKSGREWIGIPLWVHRRCKDPMFSISNEISYGGRMVQGKSKKESSGKGEWIHVKGKADDKYVEEQWEKLDEEISKRLEDPNIELKDIYVITPFRNCANKLKEKVREKLEEKGFKEKLKEKGFVINDDRSKKQISKEPINIGTIHTFQGKEAKIVYMVLGADERSKGAAIWAVSEPNLMNVAVTRAKEEFYIIGDKDLYGNLSSEVINKTISIIDGKS